MNAASTRPARHPTIALAATSAPASSAARAPRAVHAIRAGANVAADVRTMRAIRSAAYGPLEQLSLQDVPVPAIGVAEVLVRVHAAALHVGDTFAVRGRPLLMRLSTGLMKPSLGIPGFDFAGRVEAIGRDVARFRVGDEVFGAGFGGCAELAKTSESQLAHKPANLAMEEAAALATAGLAALHGLRDAGALRAGQRVLVNGASGGVGTFAIQIAKAMGAEVTGVCSTANAEMVRSIGADDVVDYTREDVTRRAGRYDLVLDNVENRSLADMRRLLTPEGTLVLNSGTGATGLAMLARLLTPLVLAPFAKQRLRRFLSRANAADLAYLTGLVEAGKLRPVVDRTYPLARTVEAQLYLESGRARGKVVVTV